MKRATAYYRNRRYYPCYFNPRPHEEGDTVTVYFPIDSRDFNPRPHEEGDDFNHSVLIAVDEISIHALMKRATIRPLIRLCSIAISIHALMKRATMSVTRLEPISYYFNPRPHEEGDAPGTNLKFDGEISIHALMKRATSDYVPWQSYFCISIHALMKRATSA